MNNKKKREKMREGTAIKTLKIKKFTKGTGEPRPRSNSSEPNKQSLSYFLAVCVSEMAF